MVGGQLKAAEVFSFESRRTAEVLQNPRPRETSGGRTWLALVDFYGFLLLALGGGGPSFVLSTRKAGSLCAGEV